MHAGRTRCRVPRAHRQAHWGQARRRWHLPPTVGRIRFLVDYKFVRAISNCDEATCFSVVAYPDIPRAEVIASALLQLKNNPRLFEKWRHRQGDAFKTNGRIFGDTDWPARDET
jgi:hypothetical protein